MLGIIFAPDLIPLVAIGYGRNKNIDISLVVKLTVFYAYNYVSHACRHVQRHIEFIQAFAAAAYGPSIYNLLVR